MATTQPTNKELKFNKIKGAPNNLRIENLDLEMLNKAAAMTDGMLTVKNEEGHPEFAIVLTEGQSVISKFALEINPKAMEDNILVCAVPGDNPDATIVRAVKFIKQIYAEAVTTAEEFDTANAAIKTV